MAGFARWLREAKNLPQSDKSAAACATPPHLEGALISRLSKNKLCDDDHIEMKAIDEASYDYNKLVDNTIDIDKVDDLYGDKLDGLDDDAYDEKLEVPGEEDLPISKSQVRLIDAWYDDEEVHLSWVLDPLSPLRYRCTGVTASKAGGLPKHVACHRALPANIVLRGFKINPVEKYTFCVALEELDNKDVPMALVLGCGTPLLVRQRAAYITVRPDPIVVPDREPIRVSEVRSNVTSDGLLTVLISVLGIPTPKQYVLPRSQRVSMPDRYLHNCYVVLAVLSRGSLVAQKDTPCQDTLAVSMEGFVRGPYEVCATISKFKTDEMHPICIVPQLLEPVGTLQMKSGLKNLNTALVGIALGLMIIVIGLVWFVRKMLKKPSEFQTHRCFRTEPVAEEIPRASYVMLTATSKV